MLQIGQAIDPTQTPRLDTLEVYAKPRTDLDIDLMEAELATDAETTQAAGSDAAGLAEGCLSMPGRILPPDPQVGCSPLSSAPSTPSQSCF